MTFLFFLGVAMTAGVVLGIAWRVAEDWYDKRTALRVESTVQDVDSVIPGAVDPAPTTVLVVSTNTSKSN